MIKASHLLLSFLSCVCLVGMIPAFSACGSDDPETPVTDPQASRVAFTYKLQLSQSVLDVSQVSATYLDENGAEKTEAVNGTVWTKSVTRTHLPAAFALKVSYVLKEGLEAGRKYDISTGVGYEYSAYNAQGVKLVSDQNMTNGQSLGVKTENLANRLGEDSYSFTIGTDGKQVK